MRSREKAGSVLVWFRNDLRLSDHPALYEAVKSGGPILPLFIWSPEEEGAWAPGAASRWWLHHSLAALRKAFREKGSDLFLLKGPVEKALLKASRESGARKVFWNRRYEPAALALEKKLEASLGRSGLEVRTFSGGLLREPWTVKNQQGGPYKVFTPFWRSLSSAVTRPPIFPAPEIVGVPAQKPVGSRIEQLGLLPKLDWAKRFTEYGTPGEEAARKTMRSFLKRAAFRYGTGRDLPAEAGTSRLSACLHFGEISVRELWSEAMKARARAKDLRAKKNLEAYLRQLGWREFAYHLLCHFPRAAREPLRKEFEKFPWRSDAKTLGLWQKGKTGYPIVDAGMRELWQTGWMHNRVRMIAASFLVKDLGIHWREGAAWFWDTLVDADLANNTLGWQWVAGCGADAAPYFRIFNPVAQGGKFDPEGRYVKKWVPELSKLPASWVHKPWTAPPDILSKAGIGIGKTYPAPVVDHGEARRAALAAYFKMRERCR
ncbi:MAG: cryptochrome/photolyase family protein [Candidatus Omnitrophota bacterium]